ncbi:hypothetical protein ANCCEY_05359 [Ancylostoma ceylanicum]|uniref:Tyrosinase copper-binding domain-containing protein n=1 Tax=Ancylostoma ceylanicum TaxID=53326 RepID=A0A0D6M6M4_9BILA|nr:hypothetical protein ANCCEY_05359 [Ancylostoma ceylanicum]
MGEQSYDGYVDKSPFKNWTTLDGRRTFKRNVGDKGYLMKETDITTITDWTNEYEHIFAHTAASLNCPNPGYWSAIEYVGSKSQLFVGGDMQDFLTATNDPLFWSLYAMVDFIWEQWRELYQPILSDREKQYPANDTTCSGPAHFRNSPMIPFNNFKVIDGLSTKYTHTFSANVELVTVLPKLKSVVHAPIIALESAMKANARTTFALKNLRLPTRIYNAKPLQINTIYDCMDLACLCRFLNGTFTSKCVLPNGEELKKAVRKEYRSLTDEERERYHKAVIAIKANGEYDKLSMIHTTSTTSPAAHGGPGFLGWHREFIKRYEIALRTVDHTVALPYWDSTIEEMLHVKQDSTLWSKELMGEPDDDGYCSGVEADSGFRFAGLPELTGLQ